MNTFFTISKALRCARTVAQVQWEVRGQAPRSKPLPPVKEDPTLSSWTKAEGNGFNGFNGFKSLFCPLKVLCLTLFNSKFLEVLSIFCPYRGAPFKVLLGTFKALRLLNVTSKLQGLGVAKVKQLRTCPRRMALMRRRTSFKRFMLLKGGLFLGCRIV